MPHKMDSERAACLHDDKAYGPVGRGPALAKGQPYICRMCGEVGSEAIITFESLDYVKTLLKKEQGGFSGPR